MASKAAALLLLGLLCFGFTAGKRATDCCLSVGSEKRLNPRNLVSYSVQKAGLGCVISATVFVNRRNMKLCVGHPDENPGVKKIIDFLDKKRRPL